MDKKPFISSTTNVPTTTTVTTTIPTTTSQEQNVQEIASGFLKNASRFTPALDIQSIDEDTHDRMVRRTAYPLCTPDNIRMRMLLSKVLSNSDVAKPGTIILPKRKAVENFPEILQEGMSLVVRDVCSEQEWTFKYKYWANNNSRMYVLEHTGEFVKKYGLVAGDTIYFFEDERNKLYVSAEKVATKTTPHILGSSPFVNFLPLNFNQYQQDEEEEVIMMLIQQLKFEEQEQAYKNATLLHMFDLGSSSSSSSHETPHSHSAPKAIVGKTTTTDDGH